MGCGICSEIVGLGCLMIVLIALQGLFGLLLIYASRNPEFLKSMAVSRQRIGLPPDLRRMKWVALLGGCGFAGWSLFQVILIAFT